MKRCVGALRGRDVCPHFMTVQRYDPDWNVGNGPALELTVEGDDTTWTAQHVWA
jgi:hypothetical protein